VKKSLENPKYLTQGRKVAKQAKGFVQAGPFTALRASFCVLGSLRATIDSFMPTMAKVKRLLTLCVLIAFQAAASGQEGKAPSGWYPEGYKGHTFTGVLQSVDESTHHIKLTYSVGYKTEVFVGVLVKGYTTHLPDGSTRPLKVSDLPIGSNLTVYYMGEAKSSGWRKVHKVFQIEGYPNLNIGHTGFISF
jgi:hypothetical protein